MRLRFQKVSRLVMSAQQGYDLAAQDFVRAASVFEEVVTLAPAGFLHRSEEHGFDPLKFGWHGASFPGCPILISAFRIPIVSREAERSAGLRKRGLAEVARLPLGATIREGAAQARYFFQLNPDVSR